MDMSWFIHFDTSTPTSVSWSSKAIIEFRVLLLCPFKDKENRQNYNFVITNHLIKEYTSFK